MTKTLILTRRGLLRATSTLCASSLAAPLLAQKRDVLTAGDQTRTTHSLLEASGQLKSVPYDLQFKQFPTAAPLMETLNAGAIAIGYGGDSSTTFTLSAGNPSKIVAAYRSDPGCIALIVPKGSTAKRIHDLVGKKVAVSRGGVGHLLVARALKQAGLPDDAVQYSFLQPADAYPALTSGSIDAWAIWTIYVVRAVQDHGARILLNGRGLVNNTAYQSARIEALATKRPLIEDYVRRVAAARRWAIENLDEYAKVWAPMIGATPQLARSAYDMERMMPVAIDDGIVKDQEGLVKYYADLNIIPKVFDIAPAFDRSFNETIAKARA